jgi:hypothetical protein
MTSKRFLFVIIGTWVTVFTCYAVVIFGTDQFYYDNIGINCEPFYREPKVTLTVLSIFYFVPAVIFVVCYGLIYRTATQRKVLTVSPDDKVSHISYSLFSMIENDPDEYTHIIIAYFYSVHIITI